MRPARLISPSPIERAFAAIPCLSTYPLPLYASVDIKLPTLNVNVLIPTTSLTVNELSKIVFPVPTIENLFPTIRPWELVVVTVVIPVLISAKIKFDIEEPLPTTDTKGDFPSVLDKNAVTLFGL